MQRLCHGFEASAREEARPHPLEYSRREVKPRTLWSPVHASSVMVEAFFGGSAAGNSTPLAVVRRK